MKNSPFGVVGSSMAVVVLVKEFSKFKVVVPLICSLSMMVVSIQSPGSLTRFLSTPLPYVLYR